MILIEPKHLTIVKNILKQYPYTFYLFGSRSSGTARPLSDMDICFLGTIPLHIRSHIAEDFENSDLPFTVDLISWDAASAAFKKMIRPQLVLLQNHSLSGLIPTP